MRGDSFVIDLLCRAATLLGENLDKLPEGARELVRDIDKEIDAWNGQREAIEKQFDITFRDAALSQSLCREHGGRGYTFDCRVCGSQKKHETPL